MCIRDRIYLVLLAGYVAYLFADIILRDLLRGESFYLVLSVIMLLVLYGLAGGIEGRARVYAVSYTHLDVYKRQVLMSGSGL